MRVFRTNICSRQSGEPSSRPTAIKPGMSRVKIVANFAGIFECRWFACSSAPVSFGAATSASAIAPRRRVFSNAFIISAALCALPGPKDDDRNCSSLTITPITRQSDGWRRCRPMIHHVGPGAAGRLVASARRSRLRPRAADRAIISLFIFAIAEIPRESAVRSGSAPAI